MTPERRERMSFLDFLYWLLEILNNLASFLNPGVPS